MKVVMPDVKTSFWETETSEEITEAKWWSFLENDKCCVISIANALKAMQDTNLPKGKFESETAKQLRTASVAGYNIVVVWYNS